MIASLTMYRRPELDGELHRLWATIASGLVERGIDAPAVLSQEADEFSVWTDPQLVLSQTCGMPYRTALRDKVEIVGTFDYGLEGCPAGYYRSAIIVRADETRSSLIDFKQDRFVINQSHSESGFTAPYRHMNQHGFWFSDIAETGGHLASARAVADGAADIAAIDAMTWKLIERYERFADGLKVIDWTEPTPGLPLITALGDQVDEIHDAVDRALHELEFSDRDRLGIKGLVRIPESAYLAVSNPPN